MQSVDLEQVNALIRRFDRALSENPRRRKLLHEEIGTTLQNTVHSNISITIDDGRGKIKSWQDKFIGSRGGYAAVRPIGGITGKNSPGAITNYLENGHEIRPPGNSPRYRERINMVYVHGRHFYAKTRKEIHAKVMPEIEKFAQDFANDLGGSK